MPFFLLPDEIILQICSLTSSPDIDNFALVNKTTYRVCYDRLKERQIIKKNARVMTKRFKLTAHKYTPQTLGFAHMRRIIVLNEIGSFHSECALEHMEYLELNGDLHWLQPMDEKSAEEARRWYQGEAAPEKKIADLEATAKRLGLQLPGGFLKMMGSNELIGRMNLGSDCFNLGSLVMCDPTDDGDGGGYMVRFLCDQQGCLFWNLYMSPDGGSCIVRSAEDVECWMCSDDGPYGNGPEIVEGHEKYILSNGVPVACNHTELALEHPNFEAWLALMYFGGWCGATLCKGRVLSKRQLEYLDYFRMKPRV